MMVDGQNDDLAFICEMEYGLKLIESIFTEVKKKFRKIQELNRTKIDSDYDKYDYEESIGSYFNLVSKTFEFILHLFPIFVFLSENSSFDENIDFNNKRLKEFIDFKRRNLSRRDFLKVMIEELGENSENDDIQVDIKNILNKLREVRNIQSHNPVNFNLEKILEIYKHKKDRHYEEIEIIGLPNQSLLDLEELLKAFYLKSEEAFLECSAFQDSHELDGFLMHKSGLLCIKNGRKVLLTYKDFKIKFKGTSKPQNFEVEYFNESEEEKILNFNELRSSVKHYFDVCIDISPNEEWELLAENIYVINTKNEILVDFYVKKIKNKQIICELHEFSEKDSPKPITFFSEPEEIKENFVQDYRIDLKKVGFDFKYKDGFNYVLSVHICDKNVYLHQGEIKDYDVITINFCCEKANEKDLEFFPILPPFTNQFLQSKVIFKVRNSGNVQKKFCIRDLNLNFEYFRFVGIFDSFGKEINDIGEKTFCLNGYNEKRFFIEIYPTRSEDKTYNVGEIKIIDLEKNIEFKKNLGTLKINKIYESQEFYDREYIKNELSSLCHFKNTNQYHYGIKTIWIKGEAGQGKSRLARELFKTSKEKNYHCAILGFDKEWGKYNQRYVDGDFLIEAGEFEVNLFLNTIKSMRFSGQNRKSIIIQFDDVHLLPKGKIKEIVSFITKINQSEKISSNNYKIPNNIIFVFYTRTKNNISNIESEKVEKIFQMLDEMKPDVFDLNVINVHGDKTLEESDILTMEDLLLSITKDIFRPHTFDLDDEIALKKILKEKTDGNLLVLQLLLEELKKKKLIVWEKESWVINWENPNVFEIPENEDIDDNSLRLENAIKHCFKNSSEIDKYLPTDRYKEIEKPDDLGIIFLLGIFSVIDKKMLNLFKLKYKNDSKLNNMIKVERKKIGNGKNTKVYYSFRYPIYQDICKTEIDLIVKQWNRLKEQIKLMGIEKRDFNKWLKLTKQYLYNELSPEDYKEALLKDNSGEKNFFSLYISVIRKRICNKKELKKIITFKELIGNKALEACAKLADEFYQLKFLFIASKFDRRLYLRKLEEFIIQFLNNQTWKQFDIIHNEIFHYINRIIMNDNLIKFTKTETLTKLHLFTANYFFCSKKYTDAMNSLKFAENSNKKNSKKYRQLYVEIQHRKADVFFSIGDYENATFHYDNALNCYHNFFEEYDKDLNIDKYRKSAILIEISSRIININSEKVKIMSKMPKVTSNKERKKILGLFDKNSKDYDDMVKKLEEQSYHNDLIENLAVVKMNQALLLSANAEYCYEIDEVKSSKKNYEKTFQIFDNIIDNITTKKIKKTVLEKGMKNFFSYYERHRFMDFEHSNIFRYFKEIKKLSHYNIELLEGVLLILNECVSKSSKLHMNNTVENWIDEAISYSKEAYRANPSNEQYINYEKELSNLKETDSKVLIATQNFAKNQRNYNNNPKKNLSDLYEKKDNRKFKQYENLNSVRLIRNDSF